MSLSTRHGPRITISTNQGHGPPPDSSSQSYDELSYDEPYIYDQLDDSALGDDEDEVDPSDSASASYVRDQYHRGPARHHQRAGPIDHYYEDFHPSPPVAPIAPANMAHPEHYQGDLRRGGPFAPQPQQGYYGAGGGRAAQGYPGHHAPYPGGPGGYGGQNGGMVQYGQAPPYGPHPGYGHEMMQYGGYYGDPRSFAIPAHMHQFQLAQVPPPTEHPGQSATPKEDPQVARLNKELQLLQMNQEKAKEAEAAKEREAQIKRDAEEAYERRRMEMEQERQRAAREIQKAALEAERKTMERIELEKKAEEQRARKHAEDMRRAEENARMRFEADQKAMEERRRIEDENRKKAEEAAEARLQKAIKAENEAREARDKKAKEDAERIKRIEEDAKRKAEADAAAKAQKEADEAKAKAEAEAAAKKEQEELKKKWQEEAKQNKDKGDKAPIKFKDAVGRKFSFPFHLCQTWTGMEELIKQAFLQVDVLGPHVQEGHYDLIGPAGEIILPTVWEKVIQPDWSITMTMWPIEKSPPIGGRPRGGIGPGGVPIPPQHTRPGGMGVPPAGRRPGVGIGVPPAPGWNGPRGRPARPTSGVADVVDAVPRTKHKKKKDDGLFKFFGGSSKPKKKSSRK